MAESARRSQRPRNPIDRLSVQDRERIEELLARVGHPLDPAELYPRVVDGALELTRADAGALVLVEEETQLLTLPLVRGFSEEAVRNLQIHVGEGVIGTVVATRRPYLVPDTHQEPRFIPGDLDVRSELAVPMLLDDRVIGALDVSAMAVGAFTEHDVEVLSVFADAVAVRVKNAQLFGETQQRAEILRALFEVGKYVSQTLDIPLLLRRIVEHARRLLGARIAAVSLLDDEEGNYLVTRAVAGGSDAYRKKPPLPIAGSLLGEVVRSKEPLQVLDVLEHPGYRYPEIAAAEGLRSLLAVPLRFRDTVLGVLSIYLGYRHVFRQDEVYTVCSLADQAAIALRNARLYERMASLEERVRHLERFGTAGEIALGFAHELRNPLTVVKVLLSEPEQLTEEDRQIILAEVNRMTTIIDRYLRFLREEPSEWTTVDLHAVIDRSLELIEHRISRREIVVRRQFAPMPVRIHGNFHQMEQVFVNLFLNAIDAMPGGGTLTVRTDADAERVRVLVEDTGQGIPREIRDRLFEPFTTSKESGIGLGLTIVKRIVSDHGGKISVSSDPGRGTQFLLEFEQAQEDES